MYDEVFREELAKYAERPEELDVEKRTAVLDRQLLEIARSRLLPVLQAAGMSNSTQHGPDDGSTGSTSLSPSHEFL